MRVWIFREDKDHWGVRYGNQWLTCKRIDIQIRLKGKTREKQPTSILVGKGKLRWIDNDTIQIYKE